MTERLQVYKCEVCGNIVEMVHEGKGELVCQYKQFCVGQEGHTITLQKKYCVEGYL